MVLRKRKRRRKSHLPQEIVDKAMREGLPGKHGEKRRPLTIAEAVELVRAEVQRRVDAGKLSKAPMVTRRNVARGISQFRKANPLTYAYGGVVYTAPKGLSLHVWNHRAYVPEIGGEKATLHETIFHFLERGKPVPINKLAGHFDITAPAVSNHLAKIERFYEAHGADITGFARGRWGGYHPGTRAEAGVTISLTQGERAWLRNEIRDSLRKERRGSGPVIGTDLTARINEAASREHEAGRQIRQRLSPATVMRYASDMLRADENLRRAIGPRLNWNPESKYLV